MESISSYYILQSDKSSIFSSKINKIQSQHTIINSKKFFFSSEILSINGNLLFTGSKLFIDFETINLYNNNDFLLSNIKTKNLLQINVKNANIKGDSFYRNYNFSSLSNIDNLNANIQTNINKFNETNVIFYHLNANVITFNGLQNLQINTINSNFKSHTSIFIYPNTQFEITCSNINFISNNQNLVITREYFNSNNILFSSINSLLESEKLYFISGWLFVLNTTNSNINTDRFQIILNQNKKLNLKSTNSIQFKYADDFTIQSFDQTYASNNLNIKSENIFLFSASQQQFASNSFNVIINDKFNLNSRQNLIRGNITLRSNVKINSNGVNLTSRIVRLSTNNNNRIAFMHSNLISNNFHAESNGLFSGNLLTLKLNSLQINGNAIVIHSNSFYDNSENSLILGNNFNILANHLNTLSKNTDIITNTVLIQSFHKDFTINNLQFVSNSHSIRTNVYTVQSQYTARLTSANIQAFSNDVMLQGNMNVSTNFLNVNSNKSNLKIGILQVNSNQFISNIQILLGNSNALNVRNNQLDLYSSEQINIKTNLFSNTEYIKIQNKDTNILASEFQNNATALNIRNPLKIEINTQNTLLFRGKTFSTTTNINQVKGNQIYVSSNSIQFNSNIDFVSKTNDLFILSKMIYVKSNILKIDSPVSIYSNNFRMNGNNTFNLFKMTTVDSLSIINSNYNLTNYDSFRSTFDKGSIFVPNITIRHKNTTILSNMLSVDNCKTFELNANINSLQLANLSYNGSRHAFIRSKALTMTSSNFKTVSNVLNIAGNLTIVSNVGNFNISNCNFTVDQFGLTNPNLTINANKTFIMKGNHLNVQSNNTVSAKGIVESNLNMNHAIIKSNLDVGSNDIIIKSNTIELAQTSSCIIKNPSGTSNIQMEHTRANIGLNRFDLQFQNANFFNSDNMQITHSNTISIECYGSHGLNADRVANITGNFYQLNNFNSQITAGNTRILFEKANIVSNAIFFTEYNNTSISSLDWNNYSTNNTVINSKQFDLNENMVILTAPSIVKIDASIQVASMSNQTNMTASNSVFMRSNALIANTQIFNVDSKHQFSIESTDLATKLINSNIQCNAVNLNANGLFITSKLISATSNNISVNVSKLKHTGNKVDLSVLNGNIRSNQMLISSTNLKYTGIDLNINAKHSANINCLRQADVEFTNNTFIYTNNLQINSVLSVFDVFTFDMKKDASVRKRLYTPALNPIGNTLQFLNAEKLNILNGYYNIKGNIGFNPSSNIMINIGTDNCNLNLKGDLNYINTNEYEFNSRNIFFNSNAKGSGTARGSGIYIRDNNDNGKSFIQVSTEEGQSYLFKPPETENTFKLPFDSFNQNGFLKCVKNGTSPIYNLQPERLQISTVGLLTTALNNKLNLSGGTMTGNLIMGANKITSNNTNSDPRDISNLTYANTKLQLSGGTMTGSIAMNSSKISSTFEPVSNFDIVNKHYLDSNKLPLSGGTLSRNLDLQDFRMSSNFVASANSDLTNRKFLYDTFLPWVGGAMKGNIEYVNSSYKITSTHEASAKPDITNKLYVDSTRVSTITNVIMLGNINMININGNTKLTSNYYAVANADITNKKYTDDNLVNLVGGNLMGNLHMGQTFKITSNNVPISSSDITNRKYLMSNILALNGGVMLGNIVMSSNLKLASNYLASANSDLTNKEFMDNNFVLFQGNNTLKGNLHFESNKLTSNFIAIDKWDIVNKKYADDTLLSLKGGILNGNITMSATYKLSSNFTPIADSDITNKHFLDMNFCSLRGNTLTGNLNMSGLFKMSSNYVAVSNSDITNKLFLDSNVLQLKGGSMLGNINMGDKKITAIGNPTKNSDLTNKQYVDTKLNLSGVDALSGNLTLKSNLVLTQQSRIIHKNGTVLFRGNVLLQTSNLSVGGNLMCENLPVVLNKILYDIQNDNINNPSQTEARSDNFTPSDIVLAMNVNGRFYVNPSVNPTIYNANPSRNDPQASTIIAEICDNQNNLIGTSLNILYSFKNTYNSGMLWLPPQHSQQTMQQSQLTFSFPSNVILFKDKTYYVKFRSTNNIPFFYLSNSASSSTTPSVAGVFHVLESPSRGDQLINKFYMDTKVDLKSNISANNVLMQGNIIINNGFIKSNPGKDIQFNANLLFSDKNTIYSNNLLNYNTVLQIGSTNTHLRITGGINKGSLLVGNTVNTTELPIGENNSLSSIINNNIVWWDRPLTTKTENSLENANLILSNNNKNELFRSNLIWNNRFLTLSTPNLFVKNMFISDNMPSQFTANTCLSKQFFDDGIVIQKLVVSNLTDTQQTLFPILSSNVGNQRLSIQKSNVNSVSTKTPFILRMDTISVGNQITVPVASVVGFSINSIVYLTYNAANFIRGKVVDIISNDLLLEILNIQTNYDVDKTFLNTTTNHTTQIINGLGVDKTSPSDFFCIPSAISKNPILYTLCDVNGNELASNSPLNGYLTLITNQLRLDISSSDNVLNNNNLIIYTIKAAINSVDFVYINLTISRSATPPGVRFSFSNNTIKTSANISWSLPNSPSPVYILNRFQSVFFLRSSFVITKVSKYIVGQISTTSVRLTTKFNVLTRSNNKLGESVSGTSSSNIASLLTLSMNGNTACIIPNNFEFVIQVQPNSTQSSGATSYKQYVSTSGNTLIGLIEGYSIDYTEGTIRLDSSNTNDIVSYRPATKTLNVYSLSTKNLPIILSNTPPPNADQQLITKSFVNNAIRSNVNNLNIISPAIIRNNIVALYNFNNNALDSSGNNNNLTNVNSVLYSNDPNRGTISNFNGGNFFQFDNNDGRFSTDNFTIACWIKPKPTNTIQSIASCRNTTPTNAGWMIYISSNHLEFWTGSAGSTWNTVRLIDAFGNLTKWVHIAITYNKSTRNLILYMNGIFKSFFTVSYNNNNGTNLRIGAGVNELITASQFLAQNTQMDQFSFYNRVLNVYEIYDIYNYNSSQFILPVLDSNKQVFSGSFLYNEYTNNLNSIFSLSNISTITNRCKLNVAPTSIQLSFLSGLTSPTPLKYNDFIKILNGRIGIGSSNNPNFPLDIQTFVITSPPTLTAAPLNVISSPPTVEIIIYNNPQSFPRQAGVSGEVGLIIGIPSGTWPTGFSNYTNVVIKNLANGQIFTLSSSSNPTYNFSLNRYLIFGEPNTASSFISTISTNTAQNIAWTGTSTLANGASSGVNLELNFSGGTGSSVSSTFRLNVNTGSIGISQGLIYSKYSSITTNTISNVSGNGSFIVGWKGYGPSYNNNNTIQQAWGISSDLSNNPAASPLIINGLPPNHTFSSQTSSGVNYNYYIGIPKMISPNYNNTGPITYSGPPIATLCCSYNGDRVYQASGTQLFFRQLSENGTSQSEGGTNIGNTLRSVSCSPNGRYVFVITQNNVFLSVNFGGSFTTISASSGTTYSNLSGTAFMTETSGNTDTLYAFATEQGGVLRRFSGVFNTINNSFTTPFTNNLTMTITGGSQTTQSSLFYFLSGKGPSMALSDDLNTLYIVATADINTSVIKVSNLKNQLQSERLVLPINLIYISVACSSNGSIVYALEENLLWRSTDAGNTFQYYPTPTVIAASIRAQFQFQSDFKVFTRNNGGPITVAGPYTSVSCDRTGNFISLCSNRFISAPTTTSITFKVFRVVYEPPQNTEMFTLNNPNDLIQFNNTTTVNVNNNLDYSLSWSGGIASVSNETNSYVPPGSRGTIRRGRVINYYQRRNIELGKTTIDASKGEFSGPLVDSTIRFRVNAARSDMSSSIITSNNQGISWTQDQQSITNNGNAWVFICNAKNNFRRVFAYNHGLYNLFIAVTSGISCRVSGVVRLSKQITQSDKRIKMNVQPIDENTSSDITKVHPKKYQFISQNKPIIGFIAQDVDSIYPKVVYKMPKIIPNFMSHVVISHHSNNIFKVLNTIPSNEFKFISNAPLENQRFKIEFQDIQTNKHFYAWTAGDGIYEKHFFIQMDDPNFIPGHYELIGQEINDCHTLNADAIFSIGVAHIQKMVDKQKAENNRISLLKNKYVSLQKLIEKQNELIDALVK